MLEVLQTIFLHLSSHDIRLDPSFLIIKPIFFFSLRNCSPVNKHKTTKPHKLPFRLDNSLPRESQLLIDCLVTSKDGGGFERSVYLSRWGLLASFLFECCVTSTSHFIQQLYFQICTQSRFCLCRAARTVIWAIEIWRETCAAFNNWKWQIGSLKGKPKRLGKWPIFQPSGIMGLF